MLGLQAKDDALAAAGKSIFSQRAYEFASASCHVAIYTVSVMLFIGCILASPTSHRMNVVLGMMFIVATVNVICHLQFLRLVLVEHSNDLHYAAILNTPYHIIDNLFMSLAAIMSDALMIWRCYVLWGNCLAIIVLPSLMMMGVLGSTILWIIDIARNDSRGFEIVGFAVPTISVATNVLVTSLISFRLIRSLSPKVRSLTSKSLYDRVIEVVIQSAALYAITGVITVTTLIIGHPSEQIIIPFYSVMPSLSTYLLVLRLRLGVDWYHSKMIVQPSRLVFAPHSTSINPSEATGATRTILTSINFISRSDGPVSSVDRIETQRVSTNKWEKSEQV